jgi:biopolymer transport protein ExbD
MAMGVGPSRGMKADINVTPLVDVVLVLLIIFMVVTPMLQRGKAVELPKSASSDAENKQVDPLVLSITPDGKVWVESTQVDAKDLESKLASELRSNPARKILLKGDASLTVGDVRTTMDVVKRSGAKSVALGVQEQKN